MYAIVNVIYGIPLNRNNEDIDRSFALDNVIDDEVSGIFRLYRGGGDCEPIAFGIAINGFDECNHHIDVSTIRMEPSEEEVQNFNDMFAALDPAVQQEMKEKFGEPRVFFLWSSS